VYDALASNLRYRYIPGLRPGYGHTDYDHSESELCDKLGRMCAESVDPRTQLVQLCELCHRPSTLTCFICQMKICDYCTRKQHWRGVWPLHWPTVDAPGLMLEKLGQSEYELKRKDDAARLDRLNPHFRTERELSDIRAFQETLRRRHYQCHKGGEDGGESDSYGLDLTRYYMWHQSQRYVYIVLHLAIGYTDRQVDVRVDHQGPHGLMLTVAVQVQEGGAPPTTSFSHHDDEETVHHGATPPRLSVSSYVPLIRRPLWGQVDPNVPIDVHICTDRRRCIIIVRKIRRPSDDNDNDDQGEEQIHGCHEHWWPVLFRGDPNGARALIPPYTLAESDEDVVMSLPVPPWIEDSDVKVAVTPCSLRVEVRNQMKIHKEFWCNNAQDHPVVQDNVLWGLHHDNGEDDEQDGNQSGIALCPGSRRLEIYLPKRVPTAEEVEYKRGVRADNLNAERFDPQGRKVKGFRFFRDDEDHYGLEPVLGALIWLETGRCPLPSRPWDRKQRGDFHSRVRTISRYEELPPDVQTFVLSLLSAWEQRIKRKENTNY